MKRESERRHKDKLNQNYESNAGAQDFNNPDEINEFLSTYHQSESRTNHSYADDPSAAKAKPTIKNSYSMANTNTKTTVRDNMFQSNTAREILSEQHGNNAKEQQTPTKRATTLNNQSNQYKRFTPKRKKRHNTAPTSESFMDYMAERDSYKYVSFYSFNFGATGSLHYS